MPIPNWLKNHAEFYSEDCQSLTQNTKDIFVSIFVPMQRKGEAGKIPRYTHFQFVLKNRNIYYPNKLTNIVVWGKHVT